jgi:hypothetical protein
LSGSILVPARSIAFAYTLIARHTQFVEVTPDKKVIWTKPGYGYGSARR